MVKNSNKVKIENNLITSNTGTGVKLQNSNNTTIQANNVTDNQNGIEITENSRSNTVADNTINDNDQNGVSIQNSPNNYVSHNTIYNNSQTGISLNQSNGNTINNGNNISGSNVGINLLNSNSNTITGNTISANTAINSTGSTGNTINNNQIFFSIDQVISGATYVKTYVDTNQKLPDNVLIGSTQVSMPQFLELLTTATIQINNGNTNPLTLKTFSAPANPIESIVAGNIFKAEYLKIANDVKNYMDSSGKTPEFAYQTSLGTYLRYENLIYMYSMIMDYYNTSGKKADFAAMKPWNIVTLPNLGTFTTDQIKTTATTVRTYIETNKRLPNSVQIGSTQISMPQFLELLTTATIQINNGNTNPIPLRTFSAPANPIESINPGNIPKAEYLKIANDIKNYMDSSGKTPEFAYQTSLGTYLRYENLIYMYSMIMDYYNTSGKKADFAAMKPWNIVTLPNLGTFTTDQIKTTATTVRTYIETNKRLPDSVLIGTTQVSMPQFLELLTTATIQINNGNTNPIPLKTFTTPPTP